MKRPKHTIDGHTQEETCPAEVPTAKRVRFRTKTSVPGTNLDQGLREAGREGKRIERSDTDHPKTEGTKQIVEEIRHPTAKKQRSPKNEIIGPSKQLTTCQKEKNTQTTDRNVVKEGTTTQYFCMDDDDEPRPIEARSLCDDAPDTDFTHDGHPTTQLHNELDDEGESGDGHEHKEVGKHVNMSRRGTFGTCNLKSVKLTHEHVTSFGNDARSHKAISCQSDSLTAGLPNQPGVSASSNSPSTLEAVGERDRGIPLKATEHLPPEMLNTNMPKEAMTAGNHDLKDGLPPSARPNGSEDACEHDYDNRTALTSTKRNTQLANMKAKQRRLGARQDGNIANSPDLPMIKHAYPQPKELQLRIDELRTTEIGKGLYGSNRRYNHKQKPSITVTSTRTIPDMTTGTENSGSSTDTVAPAFIYPKENLPNPETEEQMQQQEQQQQRQQQHLPQSPRRLFGCQSRHKSNRYDNVIIRA